MERWKGGWIDRKVWVFVEKRQVKVGSASEREEGRQDSGKFGLNSGAARKQKVDWSRVWKGDLIHR